MMDFSSIFNYYERLVFNEIADNYCCSGIDDDKLADVACIALNSIQPKYIRNAVDMSFFMTAKEYDDTQILVQKAVEQAFMKVASKEDL